MTPDFALHFTVDKLTLDARLDGVWVSLGEAPFNSGQFGTEVAALRQKAQELAAAESTVFATKLVLPNDQIKFLTLRDGAPTKLSITRALEGATPYALTEIVYDWLTLGPETRIAAVAKETLQEAEAFAREHGLAPAAFVALPDEGWEGREAFFGAAGSEHEDAERDGAPYAKGALADILAAREAAARQKAEEVATAAPQPEDTPVDAIAEAVAPEAVADAEVIEGEAPPQAQDPEPEESDVSEAPAPVAAFQSVRQIDAGAAPALGAATVPDVIDVAPKITLVAAPQEDAPSIAAPRIPSGDMPEATAMAASLRPALAADGLGFRSGAHAADRDAESYGPGAEPSASARGRPRFLGLILTVLLIIALLAVAALASIREDGLARFFEPRLPAAPDLPTSALSVPDAERPAPEIAAIAPAPLSTAPEPIDTNLAALPDTVEEEGEDATVAVIELDERGLERLYAATGIWAISPSAMVPPTATELETFYVTSIDSVIATGDAVALELSVALDADQRPPSQPLPPAPSARFEFDARGLLIATPEGSVSPLGYTVIAGRPALVPPLRLPDEVQAELDLARLAAFRPQARPETLAEDAERRANGGLTRAELAAFRPRVRPEAPKAAEEAEESDAPPSELAVANSRRPEARPRNIDRIIAAARASQPTTVAVAAPVTPRATAPSGPTRASVARAATTVDAINLRRVNLIGVYGKPSDRSALVRLANGRFVKVQVGDRVDGGRVAAIGESEIRYVKGGRNITLEIPTG